MANTYKKDSLNIYHHLLCEAHSVLRYALEECDGQCPDINLQTLFQKSCLLLGDYYSREGCREWRLALPYYYMSGTSLEEIVLSSVLQKRPESKFGAGFLNFVGYMLDGNSELVTADNTTRDLQLEESTANTLLEIFAEQEPSCLPQLLLDSRLSTHSLEYAVEKLSEGLPDYSVEDPKNEEGMVREVVVPRGDVCLSLASLFLKLDNEENARAMLDSISAEELVESCCKFPNCLWLDGATSELGRAVLTVRCDAAVDLVVRLVEGGVVDVRDGALMLGTELAPTFYETLLSAVSRKTYFEAVSLLLADVYLASVLGGKPAAVADDVVLSVTGTHSHLPRGDGHFGRRSFWLNGLPPFCGSISKSCLASRRGSSASRRGSSAPWHRCAAPSYGTLMAPRDGADTGEMRCSSCCCCWQDLIKLQSLLSSEHATRSLLDHVQTRANIYLNEKEVGGMSDMLVTVRLTCLAARKNHGEVITTLLNDFPHILVDYANEVIEENEDGWCSLYHLLLEKMKELKNERSPNANSKDYIGIFKEVLSKLVTILEPSKFISLLPPKGNLQFYLPFLERCCRITAAKKLANCIQNSGIS